MNLSKRWIALPLVMAIAACGGEPADSPDVVLTDSVLPEPAMEPGLTPDPTMGPNQVGGGQTIPMEPLQDSGVGGEATITDRGQQAEIMVRLTGTPPNGSHPGHVHTGRCSSIGGVVQPLEPISTDGAGTGTMTTTVDILPMTLMDGQHVVVYHGSGGAPITCADIPMHAM